MSILLVMLDLLAISPDQSRAGEPVTVEEIFRTDAAGIGVAGPVDDPRPWAITPSVPRDR